MKGSRRNTILISALALLWPAVSLAEGADEEDLALTYGDNSFVSIATGSRVPLTRAPAVATVITAEDIAAIGANDLDQVLETVPGLHVARSTQANMPIYVVRGINTNDYNPQILMLENGVPMTSIFTGNRGEMWGGYPVENIARIEIIRGPGSALYGADAFSGVINIITKTAADIDGTRVGTRAGSFRTRDAWLQHGGKLGPISLSSYLHVGRTDGAKETVAADAQTGVDAIFGTRASRAPGPSNVGYKSIDGQLGLEYDKWNFRAGYKKRYDVGSGTGIASALDPTGRSSNERFTTDLTYHDSDFAKDWDVTLQASYFHMKEFSDLVLFPAGTFGGAFPNGMIGNPYKWERTSRLNGSAFYTGFKNHRVRIGVGHEDADLYKVTESKNFTFTFIPGVGYVPTPLGAVAYAGPSNIFLLPHDRSLNYLYAQDEWNFAKDWHFTAGVRHDRYSDFGGTTNPRLAVVWEAAYNLTAKVLASRAFRAPSFVEQYAINNPVAIGNANLRPETIRMLETALTWTPVSDIQLGMSVFRYNIESLIRYVPNSDPTTGSTAQNTGGQRGHGMELEAVWSVSRGVRLAANYAFQQSKDESTRADAGNAPRHHAYARVDWRFMSDWTAHTQLNWVADRARVAGDARPAVADYHTVDLTLRKGAVGRSKWDFAFSIRNIFDKAIFEPSPAPGSIPNDFPQARRNLYVQLGYQL
jgi:outer membrane receptor for ferrienterochelin and colicins